MRWGDKHGGYGEHYWDYNHAGHDGHDGDESQHEPQYAHYEAEESKQHEGIRLQPRGKRYQEETQPTKVSPPAPKLSPSLAESQPKDAPSELTQSFASGFPFASGQLPFRGKRHPKGEPGVPRDFLKRHNEAYEAAEEFDSQLASRDKRQPQINTEDVEFIDDRARYKFYINQLRFKIVQGFGKLLKALLSRAFMG